MKLFQACDNIKCKPMKAEELCRIRMGYMRDFNDGVEVEPEKEASGAQLVCLRFQLALGEPPLQQSPVRRCPQPGVMQRLTRERHLANDSKPNEREKKTYTAN